MILLVSPKNQHATKRLQDEAFKLNVPMIVLSVQELAKQNFEINTNQFSVLWIRFGYPYFEQLIDLAKKIHITRKYVVDSDFMTGDFDTSKWCMYKKLMKAGVLIPNTNSPWPSPQKERVILQPAVHPIFSKEMVRACPELVEGVSYPTVLKWTYGFGGKDVFLIHNQSEFNETIKKHPLNEWLIQDYIQADWEYKVMTVGFSALPVILGFKAIADKFKIDPYRYAIFTIQDKPEVAKMAEAASKSVGFELAKVDILEKDGKLYVLEANRSPGFLPFEPYSKLNIAKEFINYLQAKV